MNEQQCSEACTDQIEAQISVQIVNFLRNQGGEQSHIADQYQKFCSTEICHFQSGIYELSNHFTYR